MRGRKAVDELLIRESDEIRGNHLRVADDSESVERQARGIEPHRRAAGIEREHAAEDVGHDDEQRAIRVERRARGTDLNAWLLRLELLKSRIG